MKHIHIDIVEEEEWRSPRGTYQLFRKSISRALGGVKDVGPWGGGHPFDFELARLPPGKSNFPLHHHSAQSELYLIVSGGGVLHCGDTANAIKAGDVFYASPGESHRIENDRTEDLIYYVIADNPPSDICTYPDSGKIFLKPQRITLLLEEVDYFDPSD
jgi:uncharacterized cupin superfamily protein